MKNTQEQQFLTPGVKKIPLCLFNILLVISLFSCSNSAHRAPVSNMNQPPSTKLHTHQVSKGDTLYSIAARYGIEYKNLCNINNIKPPYHIYPGQVIHLQGARFRQSNDINQVALGVTPSTKSGQKNYAKKSQSRVINQPLAPLAVKTQAVKSSSLVWSWPVKGRLISLFNSGNGLSKGIDIAAKLGESVRAAADGEVVYSGSGLRGYGKLLIIKHQYSYLSAYAHNSHLLAKEGDIVKRGQVIAQVGASGIGVNDVKLHFEIRRDGVPVNPVTILPR
ncbi:MAG: peptidoglycan DD-metalloendopeptidase family protein [Marinagarivorans sp.]|nr:peptidoglycan DD-metalloendopeptidase family protein [Marinagarivorans sp.]